MLHRFPVAVLLLVLTVLLVRVPAARAVEEKDIKRSVEAGVRYLKAIQGPNGVWAHAQIGATSLAGLALLECGVPPNDSSLVAAARAVRQASPTTSQTYSLALNVLFLDRLGQKEDEGLIKMMAMRLLAGQGQTGGWTYDCPLLDTPEDQRRLRERGLGGEAGGVPNPPFAPGIQPRPVVVGGAQSDNSNTQFALLGLWAARRHDVNVDQALLLADRRFRLSQNADGGWDYTSGASAGVVAVPDVRGTSTGAMTCAGLLALGFAFGVHPDATEEGQAPKPNRDANAVRDPSRDPAVRTALLTLSTAVGNPLGWRGPFPQPGVWNSLDRGYYFLWSLERVAMAFGLDTVGKKDWYKWGAEIILLTQQADGSWRGQYGEAGVDTSFALLFLRRANFAQDLTTKLRGRVRDPGEVTLKSGGIGGGSLKQGVGLRPIELKRKGDQTARGPDSADEKTGRAGSAPVAPKGSHAEQLAARLVKAPAGQQSALLDQLRDGKGGQYTQALASAIPQLGGLAKSRAREALAERLSRMAADTLRDKLRDPDLEIRRAAALACASKEDTQYVPDLIDLLKDPEPPVTRAAHVSLRELTRQDFGPSASASRAERDQAVAKWQEWWAKRGKK